MLFLRSHSVLRSISGAPILPRRPRPALNILLPNARVHRQSLGAIQCSVSIHHRPSALLYGRSSTTFQRHLLRASSVTGTARQAGPSASNGQQRSKSKDLEDDPPLEYKTTHKAEAAKSVDLSARLKDRNAPNEKGEVTRLLKLAGREWKPLSRKHPRFPSQTLSVSYSGSGNCPPLYFLGRSNVNSLLNRQNHRHRNF